MFAFTPAFGQELIWSTLEIAVLPDYPPSGISLMSSRVFVGRVPRMVVTLFNLRNFRIGKHTGCIRKNERE